MCARCHQQNRVEVTRGRQIRDQSLLATSDAKAERIFSVLSDGGEVFMPMQETFFATRFGQLRDRFGINWMILREHGPHLRENAKGGQGSIPRTR